MRVFDLTIDTAESFEFSASDVWKRAREAESGSQRSRACHDLMHTAERSGNLKLWEDIGRHLIELLERDDLSPEVSDHYVQKCPDEPFLTIAQIWTTRKPFTGWICRRNDLKRAQAREAEKRRQRERKLRKKHRH